MPATDSLDSLDSLLTLLGLLFFMFLVLAASVEAILEMFRGLLESLGITFLKGKYSVDDALKLAGEFATGDAALKAKAEALKGVVAQIKSLETEQETNTDKLFTDLSKPDSVTADIAADLSKLAGEIKASLDKSESRRIFVLRLISAMLGCWLVWLTDFRVLEILAESAHLPESFKGLQGLQHPVVNVVVGGLGAAAGSSYWHDQLDRIRNLKSVTKQLSALGK